MSIATFFVREALNDNVGVNMRFWPFIAKRVYHGYNGIVIWHAREHRKGLNSPHPDRPFWKTHYYNKLMGLSFYIGSFLFAVGSALSFIIHPHYNIANIANITYFIGSIFFTSAAAAQHFQSANAETSTYLHLLNKQAPSHKSKALKIIGWDPHSAGWWSSLTQFIGTIAFNISTFNAITPPPTHALEEIIVWGQNFIGSVFFLISGYLAFIEVSNKYWSWRPNDKSWRVVFINFIGCCAFMIAAITPQALTTYTFNSIFSYSGLYTFIGAIFFLIGSLFLIHEDS